MAAAPYQSGSRTTGQQEHRQQDAHRAAGIARLGNRIRVVVGIGRRRVVRVVLGVVRMITGLGLVVIGRCAIVRLLGGRVVFDDPQRGRFLRLLPGL